MQQQLRPVTLRPWYAACSAPSLPSGVTHRSVHTVEFVVCAQAAQPAGAVRLLLGNLADGVRLVVVSKWVGARVGIMGNPSDGFGGKTIACLTRNFGAAVTLRESSTVEIVRHPVFDPLSFGSLTALEQVASNDGYYGGIRLLYATCKKFQEHCRLHGIRLEDRNFALQYDTDIPRQVGLGGSSAIITAALHGLMEFYGLTEADIPKWEQPNLILSVETEELGIAAGLQDRVIQAHGGMVYMDFDPQHMERQGYGIYEEMPLSLLPPLYLAWTSVPSESGKMHNDVRHRFNAGDAEVISAIRAWADYTDAAREALVDGDWDTLGDLMNRNFDLRRSLYGDEGLGAINLEMVNTARSLGLPAKFAGSGGAIIGICPDETTFTRAADVFRNLGYSFEKVVPGSYQPMQQEVAMGLRGMEPQPSS